MQDTFLDGGKKVGHAPLVNGGPRLVTGQRFGDTFAAGRINGSSSDGGLVTSRNEQVSTTFRVDAENDSATIVVVPKEPAKETAPKEDKPATNPRLGDFPGNNAVQPNPLADDVGSARPITRDELTRQGQKLGSKTDGDDGRGDTQPTGGSSGPMRTTGQDDRPERAQNTGTLNLNQVLIINTRINPTRG
jgi:hypothetical protein